MTITLITLIVLTLGNIIFMSRVHKKLNKVQKTIKNQTGEILDLMTLQDIHRIQIENLSADMYDQKENWAKFNKTLNNTKLLKLSGFRKYSKKK